MTDARNHPYEQPEPEAPKELADELAALFSGSVPVPAEVDRAVLAMARRRPSRSRRRLRWAAAVAVAAAVILAVLLVPPGAPSVREDIDGNGRVDILDAFALARQVEAGRGADRQWDFNGDGIVNGADVRTVAMAAVRLDGGSL